MKALALDLSTSVGFAVGDAHAPPAFGTHRLPKPGYRFDLAGPFAALDDWLGATIECLRPSLIAIEAPLLRRAGDNIRSDWNTTRLLVGLVSIAEMQARHAGVAYVEVAVTHWKQSFTGHAFADKRQVMTRCLQLGLDVRTDHESDAIGILSHVLHAQHHPPRWDPRPTTIEHGATP